MDQVYLPVKEDTVGRRLLGGRRSKESREEEAAGGKSLKQIAGEATKEGGISPENAHELW